MTDAKYEKRLGMYETDEDRIEDCRRNNVPFARIKGKHWYTKNNGIPVMVPDDMKSPTSTIVVAPLPKSVKNPIPLISNER